MKIREKFPENQEKIQENIQAESPKTDKKALVQILILGILACCAIGYLDYFVSDIPYSLKAFLKLLLFAGTPLLYGWKVGNFALKPLFRLEKKPVILALALGFGVFAVILGTYALLKPWLDFSAITGNLDRRLQITGENFLGVAVYISLCNSFLEEFFFRGFLFFRLKQVTTLALAHGISALLFALYHVAILVAWFDWWVFALCMLGLFVGGLIFNWLDAGCHSLYPSWLTHMFANFAINTIGMMLFYS